MDDDYVPGFSLPGYIRQTATAAGLTADQVEREVAWAVRYAAETPEETIARCRRDAMRDHPFEGDGRYCTGWSEPREAGTEATGKITFRTQCGYPRDMHPEGPST